MTVAIREKPILFSGPMVRAILDGRKTQTRRIVKLKPGQSIEHGAVFSAADPFRMVWPYGEPGERLWVRETFCRKFEDGQYVYTPDGDLDGRCYHYRADGCHVVKVDGDGGTEFTKTGVESSPWKPSIFMPRHACRIMLEITAVRVERLHKITEADAEREGFVQTEIGSPRDSFQWLWGEINGKTSWDANPLVWVIGFKRTEGEA